MGWKGGGGQAIIFIVKYQISNISSLPCLEVPQEPPVLEIILGGCCRFLTGALEDGVILDVMDRPDM